MSNKIRHFGCVEVQVKDEYYIVATVDLQDKENLLFKCDLSLKDVGAGFLIDLDKSIIVQSTYKTAAFDTIGKIQAMINNKQFDNNISEMKNLYDCMMKLHDITHRED